MVRQNGIRHAFADERLFAGKSRWRCICAWKEKERIMRIAIGSDKFGFEIKEEIKKMLIENGHEVTDHGTLTEDAPRPHAEVAALVAKEIQQKKADRGMLFCGTGMGMALTANKFKGVYAGLVESVFAAEQCRLINNCNVLCMGGRIMSKYMAVLAASAFLSAGFATGFEPQRKENLQRELDRIATLEEKNFA